MANMSPPQPIRDFLLEAWETNSWKMKAPVSMFLSLRMAHKRKTSIKHGLFWPLNLVNIVLAIRWCRYRGMGLQMEAVIEPLEL